MIETKYKTLMVGVGKNITDNEVYLRIEDKDSCTGILNLCWLDPIQLGKMITELTRMKQILDERKTRLDELISKTNFSLLYRDFEQRFNKYPVQMACYEAFGKALSAGLIDEDTYYAAEKYYGRLWNYTGD